MALLKSGQVSSHCARVKARRTLFSLGELDQGFMSPALPRKETGPIPALSSTDVITSQAAGKSWS